MTDVNMPRLSDSMEEGTVIAWLLEPGAEVKRGDPIVEIETDKATMVYEADADGVLAEILAAAGETRAVGEPIARIGAPGEAPPAPPARAQAAGEPAAPLDQVKASPVARRLARSLGVEMADVTGSGPGGRIVKSDVEAAAAGERASAAGPARPAPASADGSGEATVTPLTRLQKVVSRRMTEAMAAPTFELRVEAEMTQCVAMRRSLKGAIDPVPSYNDMVVKACAIALAEMPRVNGSYVEDGIELHPRVNVGIAVAAEDALVVPTVFDADHKSLVEIAGETRALAAKVRDGSIAPAELGGGTFTVSNLGMYGIESFSAVINPPQAAILAVGALQRKALPEESGELVAKDAVGLSLVCDHRILYGADGAAFLIRVRDLLQGPYALLL